MKAQLEPGICPQCHDYLLLKSGVPFLICPLCGKSISGEVAIQTLDQRCADPKYTDALIADCVALEAQYGPELAYTILGKLVDNFPRLESPAYMITKLTGFESGTVYQYLKDYAGIKSQPSNVPWAENFLDQTLTFQNMEFAGLFFQYIDNKIRPEKQDEYREKLHKLLKEYTGRSTNPQSTKWLLTLYVVATIVNVLLFPSFMLISGATISWGWANLAINVAIALVALGVEVLLLFVHNKVYGNRIKISPTERLWMVIFLSSLVFAMGASVMGSLWKIVL